MKTQRATPPLSETQIHRWAERKLHNAEHQKGPHGGRIVNFYGVVVDVGEHEGNREAYTHTATTAVMEPDGWQYYTGGGMDSKSALITLRWCFPFLF